MDIILQALIVSIIVFISVSVAHSCAEGLYYAIFGFSITVALVMTLEKLIKK